MPKALLICAILLIPACNLQARTESPAPSPTRETAASLPNPTQTLEPSPTAAEESSPPGDPYELLIVTPAEFLEPMRKLADWKTATGISARILTLEDVDRICKGRDAPERIKTCLALYEKQSGIRYAMLVGDGDKFPIRWTQADIVGPTVGNTAYYPADLYYADLYTKDGAFDEWDSNGNGLFGEIGGEIRSGPLNIDSVDLNPDIAVGRAPVSTLTEALQYADKVIGYESGAYGAAWAHRLLAISSGGYLPDDCQRQEDMLTLIPGAWEVVKIYYAGNPCRKTSELTADNIITELNNGVGLVSFLGHGDMDVWFDAVTIKDFARVENAARLPVIFSGGCGTATFTAGPPGGPYEDVNGVHHIGGSAGEIFDSIPPAPAPLQRADNAEGMMEFSLVQTPSGVVIYVGAITGSQFPAMFDVNEFFFEGIVRAGPRVGDAWNYAIRKYYEVHLFEKEYDHVDWYVLADFHQVWKFMLFGDPSLRIGGVQPPE